MSVTLAVVIALVVILPNNIVAGWPDAQEHEISLYPFIGEYICDLTMALYPEPTV